MARKRMVDPNIWDSEDFGRLSLLAMVLFMGLFSNADDEGRGRSNPTYLKSLILPYKEDLRSADIEKALLEISTNMSVVFYSCNGNSYYWLYNWNKFQKIDRPTPSKLPNFDENTMQVLFDNDSSRTRRRLALNKNRREEKGKEENIIAPSLDEIKNYIVKNNLNVNGDEFYKYYEAGKWKDSNGNDVMNWQQKLIAWNNFDNKQGKNSAKDEKEFEKVSNDWEGCYDNDR